MNVIAIDGPTSSGKSTVAKLVAENLGFKYVNTGAIYRVATVAFLESKLEYDVEEICKLIKTNKIVFDDGKIYYNNHDFSLKVRDENIITTLTKMSAEPKIRDEINKIIRNHANVDNLVLDGRDIGSVVFPDATLKIFLDASVEVRAKRRHQENLHLDYQSIYDKLVDRDYLDSNRAIAPLKRTSDAFYLDATSKTIEEVVNLIVSLYNEVK